jgi:hypothetical protein
MPPQVRLPDTNNMMKIMDAEATVSSTLNKLGQRM